MNRVFADTSYFIAVLQRSDEAHERAARAVIASKRVITTQWVLCELANFFCRSDLKKGFVDSLSEIHQTVEIVSADDSTFSAGQRTFIRFSDKSWSLTDCISFEVMRSRKITDALTTDHHFEQAGFVALLR